MKFSTKGEKILREFINAENKPELLKELDSTIEKIGSGIVNFLKADYSRIIDECSYLEDLKEKVNNLRSINSNILKIAVELSLSAENNQKTEDELETVAGRLVIVKREVQLVQKFLKDLKDAEELLKNLEDKDRFNNSKMNVFSDDMTHYKLATSLRSMEDEQKSLSKYYFYNNINTSYVTVNLKYKNVLLAKLKQFISQDWTKIAKNISIDNRLYLFDPIDPRNFLDCDILTTIYCVKTLQFINEAESFINDLRFVEFNMQEKMMIANQEEDKNVKKDGLNNIPQKSLEEAISDMHMHKELHLDSFVSFCIGNILLSFVLSSDFPKCITFYDQMFAKLSKVQINDPKSISKLRKFVNMLKIRHLTFDTTIENMVYNHFERTFRNINILQQSKNEIIEKINTSVEFLHEINTYSHEFDELLIRKLDESFIFLINNTRDAEYFDKINLVIEIHMSVLEKPEFNKFTFDFVKEIDRSLKKKAETDISKLAKFSETHSIGDIVNKILEMRSAGNAKYRKNFAELFIKNIPEIYKKRTKDDRALLADTVKRNLLNENSE